MTTAEEISNIQDERDQARDDFRATLTELNAKVERTESSLRPDHLVESHAVGASLVAGALGFLIGSTINSRAAGPVMIGALLGFALLRRSPDNRGRRDGGNRSSKD